MSKSLRKAKTFRPAFRRRDIDRNGFDLRALRHLRVLAQPVRGRLQRLGAARHDHHMRALARQRLRAAVAQPLAGAADQRPLALDAQVHRLPALKE
jgi:hypothetical protein